MNICQPAKNVANNSQEGIKTLVEKFLTYKDESIVLNAHHSTNTILKFWKILNQIEFVKCVENRLTPLEERYVIRVTPILKE